MILGIRAAHSRCRESDGIGSELFSSRFAQVIGCSRRVTARRECQGVGTHYRIFLFLHPRKSFPKCAIGRPGGEYAIPLAGGTRECESCWDTDRSDIERTWPGEQVVPMSIFYLAFGTEPPFSRSNKGGRTLASSLLPRSPQPSLNSIPRSFHCDDLRDQTEHFGVTPCFLHFHDEGSSISIVCIRCPA